MFRAGVTATSILKKGSVAVVREKSRRSSSRSPCVAARRPVPLQVAAQIRRAIADGEAKRGERLPPARDLATVLGVNTNTVLRSLRLLQDEGLLELRRRRGITVAGTPERGAVMQKVRDLVEFARGQGYAVDELVEMIEDVA